MKKIIMTIAAVFFCAMTVSFSSCINDNDDNPVIKPNGERPSVSSVSLLERNTTSVKLSCDVISNQDFPIIEKGYFVSSNSDMSSSEKIVAEDMNMVLADLQPRKAYYVQAYAKNEIGETLSSVFLFETKSLNGQWSYAFSTKARCMAAAASDGSVLYFGLGNNGSSLFHDWNKYDPQTNTIVELRDFPGLVSYSGNENNAFFIDGVIYVTCEDNSFWAYNIKNDEWSQKANTIGERHHHVALATGGNGYYGLGQFFWTDLWEYNPQKDIWSKVTDSPFGYFSRNAVFSIGDDIYFYGRYYSDTSDFYKYNTKTKEWGKLSDFPGIACQDTFGFSIGTRGYVALGSYSINGNSAFSTELWEYSPLYDEWEKKADFPIEAIWVVGCTVGEKAYVGGGCILGPSFPDFYMFDPDK